MCCYNKTPVHFGIWNKQAIATESGRLIWAETKVDTKVLMVRCGYGLTDAERDAGYRHVDEFGRPILCDEHALL
jgi:hypothetical protein